MDSIGTGSNAENSLSPGKQQQEGSALDLNYAAQTAADSLTQNEHRQSFGAIGTLQPNQMIATDFTVAEDLHRRVGTATP